MKESSTTQNELTATEKILVAKIRLKKFFPFFAYLLHFLECQEVDWLPYPTVATDGKKFLYDVRAIDQWNVPQVIFGIAHEIVHIILDHSGRRADRDPDRWGAAIDYATNAILEKQRTDPESRKWMEPPFGILYDPKYADMTAEMIYDLLPTTLSKPKTFDVHYDAVKDRLQPQSTELKKEWSARVYGAYHEAQRQGKIPAGLERFLEELVTPQKNWRALLYSFVSQLAKNDYTFSRPNRLHLYRGIILPSCHSIEMGTVYVVIDTSGSIIEGQLIQFVSEILKIRNSYPMKLRIVVCDAEVHDTYEINKNSTFDIRKIKLHGGGGTDFRPAFEYIQKQKDKPVMAIYFTDGIGYYPERSPAYPVMWALTKDHHKPPFGRNIFINI